MSEFSELKKSSLHGITSFALRSILINVLKFLSVYLLALWFMPKDYGTFGIILSWFGVSCFFCDIGLASVLVQQQQTPSKRQLETTLALQLTLSTIIAGIFIIFARAISEYNSLGEDGVEMIRTLFVSLPVLAMRNPAKIDLERGLAFKTIAAIELIESLVLYGAQLLLAWQGLGAFSVIWANTLRTCVGSLLYLLSTKNLLIPRMNLRTLKSMLPLGSRYQLNALLPSLKAMIFPLIVGRVLDISTLGLVSWTIGIVSLPQFIALNYNSIFFPIFSKLKASKEEFNHMNMWAITLVLPCIALIYIYLAIYGGDFAALIFKSKWQEAFGYFELAAVGFFLYLVRYLLAPFFNAGGKPQTRIKIESITLFIEIVIVSGASIKFGPIGYLSAIIVTNLIALFLTARELEARLQKHLVKHLINISIVFLVVKIPALILNFTIAFPIALILGGAVTITLYADYRSILVRNLKRLRG